MPWIGGVNTSLDPGTLPPNQLVKAEHVVFGVRGSRKKRDGINNNWDSATNGTASIVGLLDLWIGSTARSHYLLGVTSAKNIYSYNAGTRSADLFAGTVWSSPVTQASFCVLGNTAVIAVDGSGNVMKKWTGSGNVADLGGSPPQASICQTHLGRIWTNDKTNPDRLQYSETGQPEIWGGTGDSGAIDIGIGDGDPVGITAIFPTFQGILFVAKRTKLYKISGLTPDTFDVQLVSAGIGCVGQNAVCAVDEDDVLFVSDRGIHSLVTTSNFGDFEGKFLSLDIQNTFNTNFVRAQLPYVQAAYLSNINSVAFCFTDSTYGTQYNNTIWLYNILLKAWYTWPNLPCTAICVGKDSDQWRFYLGTNVARVSQTFAGTNYDTDTSGNEIAIQLQVQTGTIFPEDAVLANGFKRFFLYYTPQGTHTITASLQIDNFLPQSFGFSQVDSSALLGSTFTCGSSVLGYTVVLAPYAFSMDGFGRGVQITLTQNGIQEQAEIQGFGFEYEPAGIQQEVV